LLVVMPPVAEAGAEPAVAPRGTSPEWASASPDAFTVDEAVFVRFPLPSPPTAPMWPAWALVTVVIVARPRLDTPPVVVLDGAAVPPVGVHVSP